MERFQSFVKMTPGPLPTPCAIWTGKLNQGHGYAYFKAPNGKSVRAVRWIYEQMVGPLIFEASHLCHDRRCVNPSHVVDEPHWDNVQRAVDRAA